MGIVSKTATTGLNKIKLAEGEIKKFAYSNPGHKNAADVFSIPPDDDDGSDDELSASRSGSTSSTSSSHQDSDAGDNPYRFLGVTEC